MRIPLAWPSANGHPENGFRLDTAPFKINGENLRHILLSFLSLKFDINILHKKKFLFVVFKRRRKRNNLQLVEALAQNNKLNTTLRTTLLKNSSLQEPTGSMGKEISRLKLEYDKQSQCITTLKQKLNVEIPKNSAYKKNGETLYNQIISNEPIVSWTKDDSVNFVEYYRTLRPDFVASLDNDYKKLSPRSKIILILEDIGKNIEEIKKIMSFEESSYYSAKSRINGQNHS